jgi:Zn-dependent protease
VIAELAGARGSGYNERSGSMGGALRLFRYRGVPVELHWSALLLVPFAWRASRHVLAELIALVLIVLVHELGHALLVRRYQLEVHAIRIYAFGGECRHEATRSRRQEVVIAWGGVLGQLALYGFALALLALPVQLPVELRVVLGSFTTTNLAIAAFNLLPLPPLDGYRAWRLKHLLPTRGMRRPLGPTGNRPIASLVDDALERARADSAARRRAKTRDERD